MKKFGLFLIGGIAAIVFLVNLGPMLALAITLGLGYLVVKEFLKAKTTASKIIWGLIGLMFLSASIANIPSVIGLVAAYILYIVYKNWNDKNEKTTVIDNDDPFTNFDKEWANLNKQ